MLNQGTINDIAEMKKTLDESATDEDKSSDPGYMLYNGILTTATEIFATDAFKEATAKLAASVGKETAETISTLIVLAITHSTYNSIQMYDNILIAELNKVLDDWGNRISELAGHINGHQGALEVFKKKLSDLSETVSEIQKHP